jgi:hypothetical protein
MLSLRKSIRRRLAVLLVPGGMVLGTSCAESVRESVVDGSLGFVEDTAAAVLEAWFPADALVPQE